MLVFDDTKQNSKDGFLFYHRLHIYPFYLDVCQVFFRFAPFLQSTPLGISVIETSEILPSCGRINQFGKISS